MIKRKNIPEPLRTPNLLQPVFDALQRLGGSGTNDEINQEVINSGKFTKELIDFAHGGERKSYISELEYGCAWARTILKNVGVLSNSDRAVWVITADYSKEIFLPNSTVIYKAFRAGVPLVNYSSDVRDNKEPPLEICETIPPSWKDKLSHILKSMDPFAFERLTKRLLRECGFSDVMVTPKTNDGGIDGLAVWKIGGIFSFSVAFQCKRYSGSVGAPAIRDFRGSLASDIEHGVFITTGRYTEDAKAEARADGKKRIDLLDGDDFMTKLAECQVGLKEIVVKDYEIDYKFFEEI